MATKIRKLCFVIVTVVLVALSAAMLGACGAKKDENAYEGKTNRKEDARVTYGSETYREKLVTEKYKTTGEGVTVDGVIDERAWSDTYPLAYMYGGVNAKLYTVFGEDGLYLATRMDMKAHYRVTRAADSNSGGNFFIAPADANALNENAIQIIFTARGYVMTSRGNAGGFDTWWVDTFVKTYVEGGWVEQGDADFRDEGGLESAGDYVSAEGFVPWKEIGLEEKPEKVKIMPQLNYNSNSTGYRVFAGRPAGAYNNPRDWFVFDENGYTHNDNRLAAENPDTEIAVGHGYGNISKTAAWNFDDISDGVIKSGSMQQSQFLYFKDLYAENWMIEANVKYKSATSGSIHSVGLCAEPMTSVSSATRTPVTFNLPCSDALKGQARWTVYSNTAQTNEGLSPIQGSPDVMSAFVNLKLIKTGSAFSAFVNDTYFATHTFEALSGAVLPAIVAAGVVAEFKDLRAVTDVEEIARYVQARGLDTVRLQSNAGGVLTLTAGDTTFGGTVALVPHASDAILTVRPTVLANVVYTVDSLKIDGAERITELTDGTLTFTVDGNATVEIVFARAAAPAVLTGTVVGADASQAAIRFVDVASPSAESGRILYTFANLQQSGDDAVYAFRIPDGTFKLWLEYGGNTYERLIRVSNGKIELLDAAGNVTQENVETLDFDTTVRPKTLVRNVTAWIGYPKVPLPVSHFRADETVTWDGENAQIAALDRARRTLTPVAAGSFTLTASTDGYSEVYNVTVKTVDRTGSKWQLNADKTAYAEQLREKWDADGHDGQTTLFIGDSFFDVRNFWTNFYTTYADTDAVCAGIGGTTTYDWEQYADTFLRYTAPKNIVVHLGTNNFYSDGDNAQTATENLQRLFMLVHDILPDANIYYFAITQRSNTTHKTAVSQTNAAMKQWCAEYAYITFLDTEQALTSDMLKDGIHPQLQYYSVFTDALQASDIEMQAKA